MTQHCIDNPLNTVGVIKTAHRPGSSSYFSEGALDDIGSTQLFSQSRRSTVEREKLFQIALDTKEEKTSVSMYSEIGMEILNQGCQRYQLRKVLMHSEEAKSRGPEAYYSVC